MNKLTLNHFSVVLGEGYDLQEEKYKFFQLEGLTLPFREGLVSLGEGTSKYIFALRKNTQEVIASAAQSCMQGLASWGRDVKSLCKGEVSEKDLPVLLDIVPEAEVPTLESSQIVLELPEVVSEFFFETQEIEAINDDDFEDPADDEDQDFLFEEVIDSQDLDVDSGNIWIDNEILDDLDDAIASSDH